MKKWKLWILLLAALLLAYWSVGHYMFSQADITLDRYKCDGGAPPKKGATKATSSMRRLSKMPGFHNMAAGTLAASSSSCGTRLSFACTDFKSKEVSSRANIEYQKCLRTNLKKKQLEKCRAKFKSKPNARKESAPALKESATYLTNTCKDGDLRCLQKFIMASRKHSKEKLKRSKERLKRSKEELACARLVLRMQNEKMKCANLRTTLLSSKTFQAAIEPKARKRFCRRWANVYKFLKITKGQTDCNLCTSAP